MNMKYLFKNIYPFKVTLIYFLSATDLSNLGFAFAFEFSNYAKKKNWDMAWYISHKKMIERCKARWEQREVIGKDLNNLAWRISHSEKFTGFFPWSDLAIVIIFTESSNLKIKHHDEIFRDAVRGAAKFQHSDYIKKSSLFQKLKFDFCISLAFQGFFRFKWIETWLLEENGHEL